MILIMIKQLFLIIITLIIVIIKTFDTFENEQIIHVDSSAEVHLTTYVTGCRTLYQ